jgi:hypothetical protein
MNNEYKQLHFALNAYELIGRQKTPQTMVICQISITLTVNFVYNVLSPKLSHKTNKKSYAPYMDKHAI